MAYHCVNELEDNSDEEDSANEEAELSNNENNSDSDNNNVHPHMNVFALLVILMLGANNVIRSLICAADTKQFNLGKIYCTHALTFVNQVPKTSSYNP